MLPDFIHRIILRDKGYQVLTFLTLIALFSFSHHNLYASNDNTKNNPSPTLLWGQTDGTPIAEEERHQRLKELLHYLRSEGPGWVPGLAPALQNPTLWIRNHLGVDVGLNAVDNLSDFFGDDDREIAALWKPVSTLSDPPSPEQTHAWWFAPQYHHKGFLPNHDTAMMGINMRHRLWDDFMQFDLHPFYSQRYFGQTGYWGTEMAIDIGSNQAVSQNKSWGKIVLRYTQW